MAGSETMSPESEGRVQFDELLDPSFDATRYAHDLVSRPDPTPILKADKITSIMAELSNRASQLEQRMQTTVLATHEQVLKQVLGVHGVDVALAGVEDQVREIKQYMHALRTKIRVPYEQALEYTNQASNLQLAMRHVRATSKFMQLERRLCVQLPGHILEAGAPANGSALRPDYALAALTLVDIERLVRANDLRGVDVVEHALASRVAPRRQRTVDEAEAMLGSGMQRQHQSDIGGGLQILFNLGVLPGAVNKLVQGSIAELRKGIQGRVASKALHAGVREHNAQAKSMDGRDMVGIDSILWTRLEEIADAVLARGLEMRVLERVLQRKRDVLRFDAGARGDASFLDVVAARLGDRVLALWWAAAVDAVAAELGAACGESSVVRQILTNSYPRMVQLFLPRLEPVLAPRLGGATSAQAANIVATVDPGSGALDAGDPADRDLMQSANVAYGDWGMRVLWTRLLGAFEGDYVRRAASRIDDAVARCFPAPPPAGLVDAQESWTQRHSMSARDELAAAVSVVPNRKLVASVVRSVGTELEMAKSDPRLCAMVARAAVRAVDGFVAATRDRLSGIVGNAHAVDPLAAPAHPLTRSAIGLINSVEALRAGIAELCGQQDFAVATLKPSADRAPVHAALQKCRDELSEFVAAQSSVLLDAADRAIAGALLDSEDAASWARAEQAMQWLQAQVLEPLDARPAPRVLAMTDAYLALFVHAVCATVPLTEDARLRLTSELTQLEFACSQVSAAISTRLAGAAYQSLRLMRPLLFMSAAELTRVLDPRKGEWAHVPARDLLAHVACRVATEVPAAERMLLHNLLGCSRRRWLECMAAAGA
ncbi:hypothetical protein GGF43_004062, partial [Coemansia sp. RSA 2618]